MRLLHIIGTAMAAIFISACEYEDPMLITDVDQPMAPEQMDVEYEVTPNLSERPSATDLICPGYNEVRDTCVMGSLEPGGCTRYALWPDDCLQIYPACYDASELGS